MFIFGFLVGIVATGAAIYYGIKKVEKVRSYIFDLAKPEEVN